MECCFWKTYTRIMLKLRNILTVYFFLYESQLAGSAVRRESYGIEVLLSHLLQKLQTARLAAAPVSRSTRAFLCHFHCKKRADDACLHRFSLHVFSRLFVADVVSQRTIRSCARDRLRCFFFFSSYYSNKFMHGIKDRRVRAKRRSLEWLIKIRQRIGSCIINRYFAATMRQR